MQRLVSAALASSSKGAHQVPASSYSCICSSITSMNPPISDSSRTITTTSTTSEQEQQSSPSRQPPQRDPLTAALRSEDGAARLCNPGSGDLSAALARGSSLRLLQRHYNVCVPNLRGQAILARVVKSVGGQGVGAHVVVDPGYYGLSVVAMQDLGAPQVYSATGEPRPVKDDGSGSRVRLSRGSHLKLRLGSLFTPYGDVQLEPVRVPPDVRRKLVWGELQLRMSRGSPVWGRVLNPCAGGYSVGVAGYVALLPSKQASMHNIQNIGTLQQFYIHRMDTRLRRIELSNYADSSSQQQLQQQRSSFEGGADESHWSNI